MHEETLGKEFLADSPTAGGTTSRDPLDAVAAVAEPRREQAAEAGFRDGIDAEQRNPGAREQPPEEEDGYGEFEWPDGYIADPAAVAEFVPLARKLGLPKEGAQELANLYAELDQRRNRAQAEFIAKNNAEWLREIESHPEFGGPNMERTGESVARVIRRFGSPLLTTQIRQMNVQNWPEMFYFLARVSQAMSEDCSPSGDGRFAPPKSTAQLLFPGLK